MVNVISDDLLAAVEEVAAVIAARIDVDANSLVLRKASSSSYLLVLPELALVDRLVELQPPVQALEPFDKCPGSCPTVPDQR
jgi:hypothetical protein